MRPAITFAGRCKSCRNPSPCTLIRNDSPMRVDDFDFDLPKNRIAQVPARPRDSARLLHIGERFADHLVRDLPSLLRFGDILVLNDTKVIPARLTGRRTADRGTAKVEITLHQNITESNDIQAQWRAFAKPGRKLKPGDIIEFSGVPRATVLDKRQSGNILLAFDCTTADLLERLQAAGEMPVPLYISRTQPVSEDCRDYQTIYARKPGAVAAPTAGLHFTKELFAALEDRGIAHCFVTLHVGAGTFLPVTADRLADHKMYAEIGHMTQEVADTLNAAKADGGRIVAVGTTSLRLLESALDAEGVLHPFKGETNIFITPGAPVRSADVLLTNFHLPRSTLFMLVCAFSGIDRMKAAYAHAIEQNYRFYSYGDTCLLERLDECVQL